jgi:hypothetical protein
MQIAVHPERHKHPLLVVPVRCGRTTAIPKADFGEIGAFPLSRLEPLVENQEFKVRLCSAQTVDPGKTGSGVERPAISRVRRDFRNGAAKLRLQRD